MFGHMYSVPGSNSQQESIAVSCRRLGCNRPKYRYECCTSVVPVAVAIYKIRAFFQLAPVSANGCRQQDYGLFSDVLSNNNCCNKV